MKLIVAGSRTFNNYQLLKSKLDGLLSNYKLPIEIVSGTANGADKLGERYAIERGYKLTRFPADWTLGKKAGYLRNQQMADYSSHCVIFWDGQSKGSKHMADIAKRSNLELRIINYGNDPK